MKATRLKKEMDKRGHGTGWLMEYIDVREATALRYINGDRIPKTLECIKLSNYFGVPVQELFEVKTVGV